MPPDKPLEWVLATGNPGKLKELSVLLDPLGFQIRPQSDWNLPEADETGLTFVENALIKARHASSLTGLPAIADDSGLAVDALNGGPGVRSARFAGEPSDAQANNRVLLETIAGIPAAGRTASFHCVMVALRSAADPSPLIAGGRWPGRILTTPRGSGGFGYDPLFLPDGLDQSAAELDDPAKNRISHRGQAARALVRLLADLP